jgi:hypothetical protein
MTRFALVAAFAAAICLSACANTNGLYKGPPNGAPPAAIDPAVAAAMTTVCASLPLQSAGGADNSGTWQAFTDNACGGTGRIAMAAAAPSSIPAAAPPAMPVLRLPGLTKTTNGGISYVVDFLNDDGASRSIQWRVVPKDYFGTSSGYDEAFAWNAAVVTGKTRLVLGDTGKASAQGTSVRLEVQVPVGTKIGGWSGAVRL